MKPVRLALVGFGKWGRNYVSAAHDSGEARVTHVVLRDGSPNRSAARRDGRIPFVTRTLEEALPFVDAIVYAGHPKNSAAYAELAMRAGKPILLEKPAGLSSEDAARIELAETLTGGLVLVWHLHLFAEGFEALRAMGTPIMSHASFGGPVVRDYPAAWDYGSHAAAVTLALGARVPIWVVTSGLTKTASVQALFEDDLSLTYDAYAARVEPPLTRQVRAFARAVRAGGTDDYRFGARWAVNVARILENAEAK